MNDKIKTQSVSAEEKKEIMKNKVHMVMFIVQNVARR